MKESTKNVITSRSFDIVAAHFGLTCMPVPVNMFAGNPQVQTEKRQAQPEKRGILEIRVPEQNGKLKLGLAE
jgi:hypothetical protein